MFFNGKASWIAPPDGVTRNDGCGSCMLFRRKFTGRGKLLAAVCADSEYRLFCNGIEVAQGPACGDDLVTFYDEVDLSAFLQDGENELLAEVICFAGAFPDFYRGGAPMGRMTLREAFIFDGTLERTDGTQEFIGSDCQWQAAADPARQLVRMPQIPCAGPGEKYRHRRPAKFFPAEVIEPGFSDSTVKNSMLRYRLAPRMIPVMQRENAPFAAVFDPASPVDGTLPGTVTLPPSGQIDRMLDLGYETTGRVPVEFLQGDASVELYYSENLSDGDVRHFSADKKHDLLTGPMVDAVASRGGKWVWKSFFYRAFRFVRVKISAGKKGCALRIAEVEKEFYPYRFTGEFQSENELCRRFWETGIRTLQLCSHLVFEDCPCYERLQYPADTRIAVRAALMVSGDTRLARQALLHFRHSIRDNGLTAGSYPSRSPVYLPLWSLHYAATVQELYQYTGDITLIEENYSAIGRILEFFLRYRIPGSGIGKMPFWEMADFSAKWLWFGEPPEIDEKPSAYVTFFVAECLKFYREMAILLGKNADAQCYGKIYDELKSESAVFYDPAKQMYADTPEKKSFSMLANAEAIISGISGDHTLIPRCLDDKSLAPTALFGTNFVFDALIAGNAPAEAAALLGKWQDLLIPGRTVWPEGTPIPRSECHLWSALPTVALPKLFTGLRILVPGGSKIALKPYAPFPEACQGAIPLPTGLLKYRFDGRNITFELPPGTSAVLPDDSESAAGAVITLAVNG